MRKRVAYRNLSRLLPLLLGGSLLLSGLRAISQPAYFIDGYHGGIYGHLPLWQTKFMVEKLALYPDWKINLELEPESWDSIAVSDLVSYAAFQKLFADQSSNGRIEYANPAYAQAYMYNISGESIIRQFYYGMQKLRRHFPGAIFSTYSSEEPCFTSALPQILRSYGFKYASLKNPNTCWGGYTRAFGGELVNWIGPDGSSLVTVPRYEVEALKPHSIWETIASSNSTEYVRRAFQYGILHPVGMCFQDAGWAFGPWLRGANVVPPADMTADGNAGVTGRSVTDEGAHEGEAGKNASDKNASNKTYAPTIYETWRGYIENISSHIPDRDWKFSQEDVLVSLMWGSQILQRIAREVRMSENKIIMAEKLAALARVYRGSSWPQASLDEAWRTLLLSQHHDCWIVPYNGKPGDTWADKVVTWTGNTNDRSDTILRASMERLESGASRKNSRSVRIYNTVGTARDECVRVMLPEGWRSARITDLRGREIISQLVSGEPSRSPLASTGASQSPALPSPALPLQREILFNAQTPPVGYSTYRLVKIDPAAAHTSTGGSVHTGKVATKGATAARLGNGLYLLETDLYKILIDPALGGTIRSWKAKQLGNREFVAAGSGTGGIYFNELRGNFYNAGGFHSSTETPAGIKILENGPLQVKLAITAKIAGYPFTQIITLQQGQARVDVNLVIDWQDNPAIGEYFDNPKNEQTRKAYYDDRYKLLALFPLQLASQKVYKNAPFDVAESHLSNTFFNSWDSIKNNVLLDWVDVADSAGRYGMTLLCDHTTSYVHGEDFPLGLTLQYSGNGIFYRDYKIQGASTLNYAWIPHAGKWDQAGIWTAGTKWREPLLVRVADASPGGSDDASGGGRISSVHTRSRAEPSLLRVEGARAFSSVPGLEVSSMTFSGDDLLVRLFNGEGDSSVRKIFLGFTAEAASLIELDGSRRADLSIQRDPSGQSFVEISMPRFGIRTLKFIHAQLK